MPACSCTQNGRNRCGTSKAVRSHGGNLADGHLDEDGEAGGRLLLVEHQDLDVVCDPQLRDEVHQTLRVDTHARDQDRDLKRRRKDPRGNLNISPSETHLSGELEGEIRVDRDRGGGRIQGGHRPNLMAATPSGQRKESTISFSRNTFTAPLASPTAHSVSPRCETSSSSEHRTVPPTAASHSSLPCVVYERSIPSEPATAIMHRDRQRRQEEDLPPFLASPADVVDPPSPRGHQDAEVHVVQTRHGQVHGDVSHRHLHDRYSIPIDMPYSFKYRSGKDGERIGIQDVDVGALGAQDEARHGARIRVALLQRLHARHDRGNGLTCYTCFHLGVTQMCPEGIWFKTECKDAARNGSWFCANGYDEAGKTVYAGCISSETGGCKNIELLDIFGVTVACLCEEDLCNNPHNTINSTSSSVIKSTPPPEQSTMPPLGQGASFLVPPHLFSLLVITLHRVQ
ncbi:unnamed protein product [Darwinula stevensoni]|uniref:Uncharacterized protein n=1 Tax=Darwinula stevensoni TaxID=69355 RepID=A0A7R8XEL9_9CRUS|nr:unnamed protein product [Darwinula stevensoni]CAG0887955.1 unnamed protein product [Darwinula stevensoni]